MCTTMKIDRELLFYLYFYRAFNNLAAVGVVYNCLGYIG